MNTSTQTDRIERSATLPAPRERVWQALADAEEFGRWFRVDLAGQRFEPGQRTRGRIGEPGFEHLWFDVLVQRVEPPHLLAFEWHPFPIDPSIDYAKESPTLVTFTLDDAPGGATRLTVTETGFDQLPRQRREEAWRMNGLGWEEQLRRIARHLAG